MGAALRGKDFLVSDAEFSLFHMYILVTKVNIQGIDSIPCIFYTIDGQSFCLLLCYFVKVLALPGLVWKQLTGEAVCWNKDFPAIDSVLVRLFTTVYLTFLLNKLRKQVEMYVFFHSSCSG